MWNERVNNSNDGKNMRGGISWEVQMRHHFRACSTQQGLYRPVIYASEHTKHLCGQELSSSETQCRLRNTIAEVTFQICVWLHWLGLSFVIWAVTVSVCDQVRSWWTTSHSTWAPSGRGGWFQMWSPVTWGSFSPTRRLQSPRTGRASSTTSRKSSCRE